MYSISLSSNTLDGLKQPILKYDPQNFRKENAPKILIEIGTMTIPD